MAAQIDPRELRKLLNLIALTFIGLLGYIVFTGFVIRDFMDTFSSKLIYPSIAALISLVLVGALYYRAREYSLRSIKYLLTFAILLFFFNFFQILDWETARNSSAFQRPSGHPLLALGDICIPLLVLAIFLHFNSIEKEELLTWPVIVMGIATFPSIVLSLLVIVSSNESLNTALGSVLIVLSIGVLLMAGISLRVMTRIFLSNKEGPVKAGAQTMIVSLIYMTFSFTIPAITTDVIDFYFFEAEMFSLLLFIIATVMLCYTYIKNPSFLYAIPFEIYELILYSNEGKLLWSHNFFPSLDDKEGQILKTKGLAAIGGILHEISGFRGNVKNIELTDGSVMIESNSEISVCLITEVKSPQLVGALKNFTRSFTDQFTDLEEINNIEIQTLASKFFIVKTN